MPLRFEGNQVPRWAKDPNIGHKFINARAETAAVKPSFRSAYSRRRCLVPVDGFYEWRREGEVRQPWLIAPCDEGIVAFAGLWERWRVPEGAVLRGLLSERSAGDVVETFTILTTEANETMKALHHRMPVILAYEAGEQWLAGDDLALGPTPEDLLATPADPLDRSGRCHVPTVHQVADEWRQLHHVTVYNTPTAGVDEKMSTNRHQAASGRSRTRAVVVESLAVSRQPRAGTDDHWSSCGGLRSRSDGTNHADSLFHPNNDRANRVWSPRHTKRFTTSWIIVCRSTMRAVPNEVGRRESATLSIRYLELYAHYALFVDLPDETLGIHPITIART